MSLRRSTKGVHAGPELNVASRLVELANGPEEAEQLRSIYDALEQTANELITVHLAHATKFESLLRDRSVAAQRIASTVEEHADMRAKLIERLLSQQHQVKSVLDRELWAQIVDALNDPDRMAQIVGEPVPESRGAFRQWTVRDHRERDRTSRGEARRDSARLCRLARATPRDHVGRRVGRGVPAG